MIFQGDFVEMDGIQYEAARFEIREERICLILNPISGIKNIVIYHDNMDSLTLIKTKQPKTCIIK